MKKIVSVIIFGAACAIFAANGAEPIKYGNFENWVTRNIKESKVIGGKTKQVYEIAPANSPRRWSIAKPWAS